MAKKKRTPKKAAPAKPRKTSEPSAAKSQKSAKDVLADLTPKQRDYVELRVQGKSKREAALIAGYSEESADNAKTVIESSEKIRDAFRALVHEQIDPKKIVQRISEGLDAMETEFAKFEGTISDERNVVAWGERRAYAELAVQLGGWWHPKQETSHQGSLELVVVNQVIR